MGESSTSYIVSPKTVTTRFSMLSANSGVPSMARCSCFKHLLLPIIGLSILSTLFYLISFRSLGVSVYDHRDLNILNPIRIGSELEVHGMNSPAPIFNVTRVLYNRVPKCGSRSILRVLEAVAELNKVNNAHSEIYNKKFLKPEEQEEFVEQFNALPKRTIFDRHVYHVDFSRFGSLSPAYINLIRDPYERILSRHYYILYESANTPGSVKSAFNMTFEECVKQGLRYCVSPSNLIEMVRYFCGHDDICSSKGRANDAIMLTRAKQNVIQNYAVVGLIEDLDTFFRLLEKRLPTLFAGAYRTYKEMIPQLESRYSNPNKIRPPDDIRNFVISQMRESYDFYQFIKQRNYNMLMNIVKDSE